MKRVAPMVTVVVLALGLGACQGDTDPATHVQAFSAQLNAHGRTDDGPAGTSEHRPRIEQPIG